MATYRKRGVSWVAEVYVKGNRKSKSFPLKSEAKSWAAEQEIELGSRKSRAKKSDKTFAEIAQTYADKVSTTKRGERWEKVRIKAFERTLPFWSKRLSDVTPEHLGEWRDQRSKEVSVGSVRREYNLIRSIFEHSRLELRMIDHNPCQDVKMPSKPRSRTRRISSVEITAMLDTLGYAEGAVADSGYDEVAIAFLIALETAMRASEIVTLTWDQVYDDYVHLEQTKNGDERDVPLSSRAIYLFTRLPRSRPNCFSISPESLSTLFRKKRVEAGLDGFRFHDSRREALTRLSRKLNVLELAKMVGHRDPRSLMIYYQESASETAKKLG